MRGVTSPTKCGFQMTCCEVSQDLVREAKAQAEALPVAWKATRRWTCRWGRGHALVAISSPPAMSSQTAAQSMTK